MTPIEAFRYLLVTMLVANWLCGFAASCAVGLGPDWESTKQFAKLVPALWERLLEVYELGARRAARLVRRASLAFDSLRRRWTPALRHRDVAPASAKAAPEALAEPTADKRSAEAGILLGELLAANTVWNAWSARRRNTAVELDRLAAESEVDLKSLRRTAERLRGTMSESDAEWNSLFDRLKSFGGDDDRRPLRDVLGTYRRDGKLLGAAVWASAAGLEVTKIDQGRRKVREALRQEAATLDRICRTSFIETAKLLEPVKARDVGRSLEVADPTKSAVEACIWASQNLGPTYSVAILEPLDEAEHPPALHRVERSERLRAELRDALGVDEILVKATEPFVVLLSPAHAGRALATRLETLRAAWSARLETGSAAAMQDEAFVGAVHATVTSPLPDEDVFALFARLVSSHERTSKEQAGRVVLSENGQLTVLEPRTVPVGSIDAAPSTPAFSPTEEAAGLAVPVGS
ncbi:MAG TPA: hypothetical protein VGN57_13560 [Pirellulaceae bacterium]|jgi:hypothetical protein|nr:hypothetical protein [Pirellulaceae bacterium]